MGPERVSIREIRGSFHYTWLATNTRQGDYYHQVANGTQKEAEYLRELRVLCGEKKSSP